MEKGVLLIAIGQTDACGLRYLSSSLAVDNLRTYMIYYLGEHPDNLNVLSRFVEQNNVVIVGISVFSTLKSTAILITEALKKKHNIPIIWGGPHVNSDPDDAIVHADIIGLQDCEIPFRNLVNIFLKRGDIRNINNFWVKKGNIIIKNPVEIIEDVDPYPFPDWRTDNHFFIRDGIIEKEKEPQVQGTYKVFGSRGCPFNCSYCANKVIKDNSGKPQKYYRVRSVDNIILEIESAIKNFPLIREISFYDELFGINQKWVEEFCNEYSQRIRLPFGMISNPINMTEEKLENFKRIGLKYMGLGLQSASHRIRKIYKRPETITKIKKINYILNRLRITHFFDIIVDNPLETKEDLIETLLFLLELKKPFLAKTFDLMHLPKTELTEKLLNEGYITKNDVEGNKKTIYLSWRVNSENIDRKTNRYIIALIQLTGNIIIPNWIIKRMLLLEYKINKKLKTKFEKIILNEVFYNLSATMNANAMINKYLIIKKIGKSIIVNLKKHFVAKNRQPFQRLLI